MLNLDDLMFTYKVGKLLPYFDWVIWGGAICFGLFKPIFEKLIEFYKIIKI